MFCVLSEFVVPPSGRSFFMRKTIRRSALLDRLGQSANMRMSARAQKLGLFLSVDVDDIQTVRTNQNPRERVCEKGNRP